MSRATTPFIHSLPVMSLNAPPPTPIPATLCLAQVHTLAIPPCGAWGGSQEAEGRQPTAEYEGTTSRKEGCLEHCVKAVSHATFTLQHWSAATTPPGGLVGCFAVSAQARLACTHNRLIHDPKVRWLSAITYVVTNQASDVCK
jgi:hypothetical protein